MKQYILGIGCKRGVSCSEIEQAVQAVLDAYNIDSERIYEIVSCDLKVNENGLLNFVKKWQLAIRFFSSKELKSLDVPNPSARVIEKIGIPSVCEAAAKLAGNGILLVEKQKFGNITIAIGESKENL